MVKLGSESKPVKLAPSCIIIIISTFGVYSLHKLKLQFAKHNFVISRLEGNTDL